LITLNSGSYFHGTQELARGEQPKGWYHLSKNDLGEEFEFTPRQTTSPYMGQDGTVIEDDFSLRTSWAPTVNKALEALEALQDMHGRNRTLHVYYTKSLPGKVDLEKKMEKCPSSPGNEYGEDFSTRKWREWVDDTGDPKQVKKTRTPAPRTRSSVPIAFKGCVPDADKTDEVWATKPLVAKRVGYVVAGVFNSNEV